MAAQVPSPDSARARSGQPHLGQPARMSLDEGAHHRADVGVQPVPDQDDRGLQFLVRGGDQPRRSLLRTSSGARPCARGGRGPGRTGGPARRASGTPGPPPTPARSPCRTRGRPGSGRGAPRSGPSAGAGSARPRPRSTHTPRSPPLASHLRPGHRPPRRDRVLVALRGPVHRHLRASPGRGSRNQVPRSVYRVTWNSRPITAATRSRGCRWSSAQPHTAGPGFSAARSRTSCAPLSRPAAPPGPRDASAARPPSRQRRRHAYAELHETRSRRATSGGVTLYRFRTSIAGAVTCGLAG